MASIYREFGIAVPADVAWRAIRDAGAVHERLARGFVVGTVLEGDERVVTFANGFVARERILAIDDEHRRLAYHVIDAGMTHHNASFQVIPESPASARIVWVTDLLPDQMKEPIGQMVDQGVEAIRQTLVGAHAAAR